MQARRVKMVRAKRPNQNIGRIFFTFAEAQDFLGISHQTLYKLMAEGLPSHKIGKKRVFFERGAHSVDKRTLTHIQRFRENKIAPRAEEK